MTATSSQVIQPSRSVKSSSHLGSNLASSQSSSLGFQHLSSQQQQQQQQQQQTPTTPQICGPTTSGPHWPLPFVSSTFQQIKQTQASLARLSRVHQQLAQSQTNQSSQHHPNSNHNNNNNPAAKSSSADSAPASAETLSQPPSQLTQRSTTFVDCLIRRFKDCFSEDFCEVPVFVVGNLSPGSDGTHLIVPPCVFLGGQNISRFSSPKNLRLMNSIRDSCKSVEELDLGGNRLTDLIEVYKMLQCMPNLRFLNLSENDLSRTSPVAMASSTSTGIISGSSMASPGSSGLTGSSQWLSTPQRNCLAPLNQNQHPIGLRRHSTLGQSTSTNGAASPISATSRHHAQHIGNPTGVMSSTGQGGISRHTASSARRLGAATAALAQSKKTSSSAASKITGAPVASSRVRVGSSNVQTTSNQRSTNIAKASIATPETSAGSPSSSTSPSITCCRGSTMNSVDAVRQPVAEANITNISSTKAPRVNQLLSALGPSRSARTTPSKGRTGSTSTMSLARSLSSLSAKDVRGLGSSSSLSGRISSAYQQRKDSMAARTRNGADQMRCAVGSSARATTRSLSHEDEHEGPQGFTSNLPTSKSINEKLFSVNLVDAPIAETETDMVIDTCEPTSLPDITTQNHDQPRQSTPINDQQSVELHQRNSSDQPTSNSVQHNTISNNSNHHHNTAHSSTTGLSRTYQQHPFTTGTYSGTSQSQQNFRRTFGSIKGLALNNTGCPWRVVCSILNRMPNLEELHLSLNNYDRIDLDRNNFKHHSLKRLYLCNNPKLTDWQELDKLLIAFPSLEALSIADCNISQIPDNLDRSREWRRICGLNINGWPIKEWPIIERLNRLPSLIDLKCQNLEILNNIDEPRHHLIARLPNLQRLNGSEIEEREHAEKAFLRFFLANSHLERPTRFHELVQIHGEIAPIDIVDVDLSPPSHALVRVVYLNRNFYENENEDLLMSEDFLTKIMDNFDPHNNEVVQVNSAGPSSLENMELGDGNSPSQPDNDDKDRPCDDQPVRLFKNDTQEAVALNVDLRQSVRKFKSTLANIFGFENRQNLILYYIDHEMVGLMGPELIKHSQKKLWNYNVQDGDQFIVEER